METAEAYVRAGTLLPGVARLRAGAGGSFRACPPARGEQGLRGRLRGGGFEATLWLLNLLIFYAFAQWRHGRVAFGPVRWGRAPSVRERGPAAAGEGEEAAAEEPIGKDLVSFGTGNGVFLPLLFLLVRMQIFLGLFEMASLQWKCCNPTHLPQVTGCGSLKMPEPCGLNSGEETSCCQICLVIAFSEAVMHCLIPLKALAEYRLL